MNTYFRPRKPPLTTQAAEGLARRRWSIAEVEALVAAGILGEDERLELIGGEIVPMSPKGNRHESIKIALNRFFVRKLPDEFSLAPETTLRLDHDFFLEPDLLVHDSFVEIKELTPAHIKLVVKISESSLSYHLGRKALIYASWKVRELWVIDTTTLNIHQHRRRGANGYEEVSVFPPDTVTAPEFDPTIAFALGSIKLA